MIVFISCAKSKQKSRSMAQDMYISPLFKKQLAFAKTFNPDKIYILSAKYGVVELEQYISPYDLTLNDMPNSKRKEWAYKCYLQLKKKNINFNEKAIFLCGENYHKYLSQVFKNAEIPLGDLPFGKRLQYLNQYLKERREND